MFAPRHFATSLPGRLLWKVGVDGRAVDAPGAKY